MIPFSRQYLAGGNILQGKVGFDQSWELKGQIFSNL